jgi:ribosomal-protein-serine acetyltransferase
MTFVYTRTFVIKVRDNIALRFIRPDEAETLYALVDKNRAYLRERLDWVDAQTGPEVSRENILKRIEEASEGNAFDLGVYTDGKLIGSIGFNGIKESKRRAEIGYWLSEEYEGQGIMTDCVRALVDYGFKEMKLHRIEIRCSTNNVKSSAVPERLGFKLDGILRDHSFLYDHFESSKVYSMLEDEWERRTSRKFVSER